MLVKLKKQKFAPTLFFTFFYLCFDLLFVLVFTLVVTFQNLVAVSYLFRWVVEFFILFLTTRYIHGRYFKKYPVTPLFLAALAFMVCVFGDFLISVIMLIFLWR